MKIKFLALAMIAMLFTACKPDPQGGEGSDPNNGEVENSYIAISIASADKDRGEDGFDEGTDAERAVESAYVFFFTDGAPFTGATSSYNYQLIGVDSLNSFIGAQGNVSDYSQKVLVIRNYKGELPNQMVAVLNWVPRAQNYSISDLKGALEDKHTIVANQNTNGKFIMSNSVFKNAAGDVYATPLAITDFKATATEAKANAVQVYVERVAAKVTVNTPNATVPEEHKFALLKKGGTENLMIDGQQVYAKILGWELYNDNAKSNLLKNIDDLPAHNDNTTYGFYWNDAPQYRSYWASNTQVPNDAQINYEVKNYPEYVYCGENTSKNHTTVILKAQLQYENGTPMEVAKWFGTEYVGRNELIKAVKNTLVTTYYTKNKEGQYVSITENDLMIVNGTGAVNEEGEKIDAEVYQVYFQFRNDGEKKTWYKRDGDQFNKIEIAALNSELKTNIGTALLYPNGDTYYFTEIKHFGSNEITNYGVVRNHVYNININSISGYGTPALGGDVVITEPEIPADDKETFVSAQINILSWKIVTNDVNL